MIPKPEALSPINELLRTCSAKSIVLMRVLLLAMFLTSLACENNTDSSVQLFNEGFEHQKRAEYDQALEKYEEALRVRPGYLQVHVSIGNVLEEKGLIDKAIEEYDKVLSQKPDHVMALVNKGNALRKRGQLPAAMAALEQAAKLSPGEAWIVDTLGNIYEESGRLDDAIIQYELAVELQPNDPEFHTDLANAYLKKSLPSKAIEHYKKVYEIVQGLESYAREERFAREMVQVLTSQQEQSQP